MRIGDRVRYKPNGQEGYVNNCSDGWATVLLDDGQIITFQSMDLELADRPTDAPVQEQEHKPIKFREWL